MFRKQTLLTQVLLANLVLVTASVLTAAAVANPSFETSGPGRSGIVLALAVALTVLVNVAMLQRRFRPLERLIQAMEDADLTGPGSRGILEPSSDVPADVIRLENSFKRMLVRLESERRRAAHAAVDGQERERARIARDLHDEVNQSLTGVLLRLEAVRSQAPPALAEELADIRALANQAMEELLSLSRQLRPTTLDDLGLKAALAGHLEQLARQTDIQTSFEANGTFAELDDETQLAAYRVAQEAISNVIQHAGATTVEVSLRREADGIELRIRDDGTGLNGSSVGHGIRGMRERALLAGGELKMDSRLGEGTEVRLRIGER